MTIAKINGIDIYYEEHGDAKAEPLLLIMGFMTNAGAWAGQIPALAPHYRVVAFDNRGCGRSESPEGPYTIAQMADDAAALLDYLGIESAHIVGASMGGMIAQEFTLRHASKVRTLTLMCTAYGGPHALGWDEMRETSKPEAMQEAMLTSFTPEFLAKPNETFQQTVVTTMQFPPTLTGMKAQNLAILAFDTYDRLPSIKVPTLVMTGADDGLLDPGNSPLLAERIPGAELRMFANTRHGFNIEAVDEVNAVLLAFLAKHSAVPAA